MSNDLGLVASAGVNSFARGWELGERMKARKDETQWAEEQKERQRSDWQYTDQERAREDKKRRLEAVTLAIDNGMEVDPDEAIEAFRGADVDMPKYFDPKMSEYISTTQDAARRFAEGTLDQAGIAAAASAFDWRYRDRITQGVGTVTEQDYEVAPGVKLPKGSTIKSKHVAGFLPGASGRGVVLDLEVEAQTPDGKVVKYNPPATKNRSMEPDDEVLEIPLQQIIDNTKADSLLLRAFTESPEYKKLAQYALTKVGGTPSAKFDTVKVNEGDEEITYQVDARGNRKEIGRSPRWQPEKPEKGTDDQREYDLARKEGFKGTFLDFKQAQKGGGLSVTLPDGTVVQQGGAPTKLTEQQSKDLVYFTRGQSSLQTLDPIADELAVPSQVAAGAVPLVGNAMVSPKFQQADQAGREFLAAILRKDTGAAITSKEMEIYGKTYLPQPFDSREVLEQKKVARTIALDAIKRGLGPAQVLAQTKEQLAASKAEVTGGPKVGQVEDGFRFKGGNPADPKSWEKAQ